MREASQEAVEKAERIIEQIIYINIATVSADGQPWNTPVYSAYDESYNFYWLSDQAGQHSQNVKANGRVFLTIYDSTVPEGTGEGVFVKAMASELSDPEEIKQALALLYSRKNQDPAKRRPDEFLGDYPRRVYKAVPEKIWINGHGDINGNYIDTRIEVILI